MSTFVLVHGAWHDDRCWSRVAPILRSQGHRVFTPSLTGHGNKRHLLSPTVGLNTHVDDVASIIANGGLEEVVLVGHSYAGMIISSVANRIPERIARLVFLDAMAPEHAQSAVDVMPAAQTLIDEASSNDEPWRIPPLPEMPPPVGLFGVTDSEDVAWLASTLSDDSVLCFTEPTQLDNPAQAEIPRTYVNCVGPDPENTLRTPVPEDLADPKSARVYDLKAGHDCMITVPLELAEILDEQAR